MKKLFTTSVGRKFLVGLTGIGVSGFVLTHMAGNLLLLVSPEAYNHYADGITSNPLIYFAETMLALLFLAHIGLALSLVKRNKSAKPVNAHQLPKGDKRSTFASRTMVLSGLLILVFLVLHIKAFRLGPYYPVVYNGIEMRDMYRVVFEYFQDPIAAAWYVFAVIVLGLHLSHGISAVFQSLGLAGANRPLYKKVAYVFAIVVAVGFIAQPVGLFFCGGR